MSQTFSKEDRKNKIRCGEPIELLGLTFYPIKMRYYELFLAYVDSIMVRQAALPVKYAVKDYVSAIWALEIDSVLSKGVKLGLFEALIRLLYLSLRIPIDYDDFMRNKLIVKKEQDEIVVDHIDITQNEKTVSLTPAEFSLKIRPLIAEQNGIELPKEYENLDLVRDNEELARRANAKLRLDQNLDDLIASVAYLSGISETEINDWTVKQFLSRRRAIDRDKNYMLYGQSELTGMVKFEKGNPYPSWCFDKLNDSMGTVSMDTLGKIFGDSNT